MSKTKKNKEPRPKKFVKFDDSPFYGREETVRDSDYFDDQLCPLSFFSSTSLLDLPRKFQANYLGFEPVEGLWGLKVVRKPVDHLVAQEKTNNAKNTSKTDNQFGKRALVTITESGILLEHQKCATTSNIHQGFPIENIAYGVQDTHYTRVFAIICIHEKTGTPQEPVFKCHVFLCQNSLLARKAAQSLATAFHIFGESLALPGYCSHGKRSIYIDLKKEQDSDTSGKGSINEEIQPSDSEA